MYIRCLLLLFLLLPVACAHNAISAHSESNLPPLPSNSKPRPDQFNCRYGPYERNVLDFWKASSSRPTPVLIFFHGGGFVGGDKWTLDPDLLERCRAAGISVASANYRLSTQAIFPAPMLDGARAIQFLRYKSKEWNIDPTRIAASGSSAGAGITLWVGYHGDLADPKSSDPVLRQSSRVAAMAVWGAQCSYDLRFIRQNIGGRAYEHPALPMLYGLKRDELDTPHAYELYEAAAAITYVSSNAPPVFMYYTESKDPLPPGLNTGPTLDYPQYGEKVAGQPNPGNGIHHPKFGELLKAKLDPLGVECVLRHRDDYPGIEKPDLAANADVVSFLKRHFKM